MTNLLQRLAKSRAALAGWRVAAALLFLAPGAALAAERELDFRGQKIVVNGLSEGDWEYVGEPNSGTEELILIFTNVASAVNTFKLPYAAEARVLAVGGGGAGGTTRTSSITGHPGGGGGGGGEVVL